MVPFPRARLIASTHSSVPARVSAASAATRRLPTSAVAVQRYGRAALNELPFTAGLVAVALIALAASGLSFAWRPVVLWSSWLANLPIVALFFYLGFWFHVF
jgi:hypothetical protein